VLDNEVDLTPNPTCANQSADEFSIIDTGEVGVDAWALCVGQTESLPLDGTEDNIFVGQGSAAYTETALANGALKYDTTADTFSTANLADLGDVSGSTGTGQVARETSPTFLTGITVPADSISDEELDESAAFVWTGAHSFSGASAFFGLPYGTAPVVSGADGRIALDTTDNQIILRSTVDIVIPTRPTKCATIGALAAADEVPFWLPDDGIVVTNGWCSCLGANCATPAQFVFSDDIAGNDMTGTITCSDYPVADSKVAISAGGTINAFEAIVIDVTNTPTADGEYLVCLDYTTTRE
jgi:hypothetical protein